MAESRRYSPNAQLDIEQILLEAQHRWLRPAEICEILQNHEKFRITPEPPNRPPSGSLFLFDRKVLRYFRKDGHSWRKKKDGKTVKEAHERLKAGSVDVLHCYYAHGEDNENFQRRSYWLLEEELSHIVLVHYQEVQGSRTYNRTRDADGTPSNNTRKNGDLSNSDAYSSLDSRSQQHDRRGVSQVTDTTSLNSTASEYEDAESVYRHQASTGFQSFQEIQSATVKHTDVGSSPYHPVSISNNYQGQLPTIPGMSFESTPQGYWGNVVDSSKTGYQSMNLPDQAFTDFSSGLEVWQKSGGKVNLEQNAYYSSLTQPLPNDVMAKPNQVELCDSLGLPNTYLTELSGQHVQTDLQLQTVNAEDKSNYPYLRQPMLDGVIGEGLKKLDSFDRWMSKELGDVAESTLQPGSGAYWDTVGSEDGDNSGISNQVALENYVLSPSLSQDQLFTINDFSPNWALSGSEIKVLISGRFLRNREEMEKNTWACMFGEIEVPAQIVGDGVLQCHTPSHEKGRVPFYITCSNRLACSEIREFEFQESSFTPDETLLHMRFVKLLSLTNQAPIQTRSTETLELCSRISALFEDDTEWEQLLNHSKQDDFSLADEMKDQLLQKLLKEKLHAWLIQKVSEDDKGPCVLDEGGQGVVHFAAALGYDWSIPPTVAAGVSLNFRDANGWTALHWAAYYGRERTVGFLISLGAAPGLLTDPTPVYPSGRTPSDLAAGNGHKGIAGYLAESSLSSLSSHLSSLELKDSDDRSVKDVETVSGDLMLKDSLAAVRNATQAAARIHQVFRYQSFQRKQMEEYGGSEFGISDEQALSLIAGKSNKGGRRHDEPVHAAATRIQNKFRSWKGRKEFLLIRKRIIKIQAHVRGHQVRKNYKKIVWSVWFIDRAILRWRRKRKGLTGPKPETHAGTSMEDNEKNEDDYDFLKEGRKQTEERLQKALARVKSMVKYPDAQDQYHRLLNVVSELQETKDKVLNSTEVVFDDDLIDFDTLWDDDDDTFMQTAS